MQKMKKLVIGLSLAVLLACGAIGVSAKSDSLRARHLTGIIVSVDREARTLEVREMSGDKTITVKVPFGQRVRAINPDRGEVEFEQLHQAMRIEAIVR